MQNYSKNINQKKTKIMCVSRMENSQIEIQVDGQLVEQVNCET